MSKQETIKEDKAGEYANKLYSAIVLVLEDKENDCHIPQSDLKKGENLTEFFHALANIMPCALFNNITGKQKNLLEFNHVSNELCFQFYNPNENDK